MKPCATCQTETDNSPALCGPCRAERRRHGQVKGRQLTSLRRRGEAA